jgi:FkbM family methyltransferase
MFNEIMINQEYDIGISFDNKIVFDIGANMGLFSVWINKNFQNVKVHCFEPIKEVFEVAKHNINITNKNNNKYILNNIGLSNQNTYTEITYYPYANGLSTINNQINKKLEYHSILEQIVLPFVTKTKENINIKLEKASEYIKNNNITEIDICKIDVEGHELDVLLGFEDFINDVKIFILEVEHYVPENLENVRKLLTNFDVKNVSTQDATVCVKIIAKNKNVNF